MVLQHERSIHGEVLYAWHQLFRLDLENVSPSFEEQSQVSLEHPLTEFLSIAEMAIEESRCVRRVQRARDEAVNELLLVTGMACEGYCPKAVRHMQAMMAATVSCLIGLFMGVMRFWCVIWIVLVFRKGCRGCL